MTNELTIKTEKTPLRFKSFQLHFYAINNSSYLLSDKQTILD